MSQMIFALAFLVSFAVLAIAVDRWVKRWQEGRAAKTAQAEEVKEADQPPVTNNPAEQAQRFRAWANNAFTHKPELQRWLNSLSETGMQGLTVEITAFMQQTGVDLDWLMTNDLPHHPATQRQLTEMIWHYCQAWHDASSAYKVVKALQTWHAFEDNPTAKSHQPLVQALTTRLIEQKLLPPIAPEMLVASEQERQTQTIQMIRAVAQNEPARFYQILPDAVTAAKATNQTGFFALGEAIQQAFAGRLGKKNGVPPARVNGKTGVVS